jgi:hypothetical protein
MPVITVHGIVTKNYKIIIIGNTTIGKTVSKCHAWIKDMIPVQKKNLRIYRERRIFLHCWGV